MNRRPIDRPAERPTDVEGAYAWCQKMAQEHYENFPVASRLLPARMRRHIAAIYAFARTADDFADEGETPVSERLNALDKWEGRLERSLHGEERDPIFIALAATIRETGIPISLLKDLLTAFRQDARNEGYATEEDLLTYCRYSANPIGRLVLHLYGYADEERVRLSDHVCTGLQLANFWQDLSIDIPRERINVPRETMAEFGYTIDELEGGVENDAFAAMMIHLTDLADFHLRSGRDLPRLIPSRRLRLELKGTILGGMTIVRKIRELDYYLLNDRPSITKKDIAGITFRLLF